VYSCFQEFQRVLSQNMELQRLVAHFSSSLTEKQEELVSIQKLNRALCGSENVKTLQQHISFAEESDDEEDY